MGTFIVWVLTATASSLPPLQRADAAFASRKDPARAREALELYRVLSKEGSSGSLWRVSMACQYVGARVELNSEKQRDLYEEGALAAERALATDTDCVPCHFWYAVNRALYADQVGIMKMLFSLNAVQNHLEDAAKRDPSYALGGPYRVLGVIQQRLPGILGGSHERARAYFEKAVAAFPEEPMNHILLARHALERDDNPSLARVLVQRGLKLSRVTVGVPESEEAWEELKEFAEGLSPAPSTPAHAS